MTSQNILPFIPKFFHSLSTQEVDTTIYGEPESLVDIFYVQPSSEDAAQLIAVTGCPGRRLRISVGNEGIEQLPSFIRNQINDIKVSNRHYLRSIYGSEITFFLLNGVEQHVQIQGFNDALYLHSSLESQLQFSANQIHQTPLLIEGWLTTSRLDVLFACLKSFDYPFQLPYQDSKPYFSLLVPTSDNLKLGYGVGIIYPLTDFKTLNSVGNLQIVMRIAYDALIRLQKDMHDEGLRHPFTQATIPIPNRRRLELELQGEGYTIDHNEAIRRQNTHSDQNSTFLSYIRRLFPDTWLADRISLPPQATIQDYKAHIQSALNAVSKPADQEIFAIITGWTQANISRPTTAPTITSNPSVPPQMVAKNPNKKSIPHKQKQKDWSKDFETPVEAPRQVVDRSKWAADFDMPSPHAGWENSSNRQDWQLDLEDKPDL